VDTGYLGHHYWTPTRGGSTRRSATWSPTLEPGRYRVLVKVPKARALTRSAVYRVRTVDGSVRRRVDQARARGRWATLGTYTFSVDAQVRLSDRTGERTALGRRVAYDAVRFVPVRMTPGTSTRMATKPATPEGPRPRGQGTDLGQPTPPPEIAQPARGVAKPGPRPGPAPAPGPPPSPSPGAEDGQPDDATGPDATGDG
jgi:hypothetical protein